MFSRGGLENAFQKEACRGGLQHDAEDFGKGRLLIEAQKVFKKALNSLIRQAFKRDLKKNILKKPYLQKSLMGLQKGDAKMKPQQGTFTTGPI